MLHDPSQGARGHMAENVIRRQRLIVLKIHNRLGLPAWPTVQHRGPSFHWEFGARARDTTRQTGRTTDGTPRRTPTDRLNIANGNRLGGGGNGIGCHRDGNNGRTFQGVPSGVARFRVSSQITDCSKNTSLNLFLNQTNGHNATHKICQNQ